MKTFEQLNDGELINLTNEEISHYIKLKKAETGIRIINLPETPTLQPIPEPDLETFEVLGYIFKEKEKAEEIAQTVNKYLSSAFKSDYDYWNGGNNHRYAKPFDGSLETVNIVRLYSVTVYNSIKDTLASNKKISDAYKKIEQEYKEEEEKSSGIVEDVYESISKARERIQKFIDFKSRIVDYIKLANGDKDIAWNFFDKAYSVEPSVKSMIMESDEYKDAINSYIKS